MAFENLTSGERKRLAQGILSPQEASLVSARANAKGGGQGFWSSTWGQVIRAVGIAALNFIPAVGSIASTAVGAFDKQRAASMQQKATAQYQATAQALGAQKAAEARARQPAPVLQELPGPWLPDYGNIGRTVTGYASGTLTAPAQAPDPLDEIKNAVSGFTPLHWLIAATVIGLLSWLVFIRR